MGNCAYANKSEIHAKPSSEKYQYPEFESRLLSESSTHSANFSSFHIENRNFLWFTLNSSWNEVNHSFRYDQMNKDLQSFYKQNDPNLMVDCPRLNQIVAVKIKEESSNWFRGK